LDLSFRIRLRRLVRSIQIRQRPSDLSAQLFRIRRRRLARSIRIR
jgi:hypothetical protein